MASDVNKTKLKKEFTLLDGPGSHIQNYITLGGITHQLKMGDGFLFQKKMKFLSIWKKLELSK